MSDDDATLDEKSMELLDKVDRVRDLERQKRETGRSSEEFHDLGEKVTQAARDVFDTAVSEDLGSREDSPRPEERRDDSRGDWTRLHRD